MTKEQYERATLLIKKIRTFEAAVAAMNEDGTVAAVNVYRNGAPMQNIAIINEKELNNEIKDYLVGRIYDLKKEFEEL